MTDSAPPIAKRVDSRREFHGDVFNDPYEWLRDKSNPEVVAYLEAECFAFALGRTNASHSS